MAEQIYASKENIQPLRQGRVSKQLTEALDAQANVNLDIQQSIKKQIHDYEVALHTYEGPDPLTPWIDYISWVEQYFPKSGKEGNFPLLIRKCLEMFKDDDQYKQDSRYVTLWIKYLDMQLESRSETYDMVLNHGIGTKVASFYHSWAMDLARSGNLQKADQVYKAGITAQAEPLDELLQAQQNLQFLIVKRNMDPDAEINYELEARHALNALPTIGSRNLVPIERGVPLKNFNRNTGQGTQDPRSIRSGQQTPSFQLYKDENMPIVGSKLPTHQAMKTFPSSDVMQSENRKKAKKWSECASQQPTPNAAALTTPFKLHQDARATIPESSAKKLLPNSVLHERKVSVKKELMTPLEKQETDDKMKYMFSMNKVYTGGIEFSFEELRAQQYLKRLQKLVKPTTPPPSIVCDGNKISSDTDYVIPLLCVSFNIFDNGKDVSFEELRARKYLPQPEVKIDMHPELKNPNFQFMCSVHTFVAQETDFSFEEYRAIKYLMALKGMRDRFSNSNPSTPSINSSRGTTPSDTPARLAHLSLLGQSMTVNTKEALAVVKDLWCSRVESPAPSPQPSASLAPETPFAIFCDSQPVKHSVNRDSLADRFPLASKRSLHLKQEDTNDYNDTGCNVMSPPKNISSSFPIFQDLPNDDGATKFTIFKDIKAEPEKPSFVVYQDTATVPDFPIFQDETAPRRPNFNIFEDDEKTSPQNVIPEKTSFPIFQENPIPQDENMGFVVPEIKIQTPSSEELSDKENDEPEDYVHPSEKRNLSGILTDAVNVPVDEEQKDYVEVIEENNDEEQEEVAEDGMKSMFIQTTNKIIDDVTSLTTVFKQSNFLSSTPYQQNTQSLLTRVLNQDGDEDNNWNRELVNTAPTKKDLSVILEVTGESRGSRSGSSTGSTNTTSHVFSKTPGQFSSVGESRFAVSTTFKTLANAESRLGLSIVRPVRLSDLLDTEEESPDANKQSDQVEIIENIERLNISCEEIDPFDDRIRERLLNHLPIPCSSRSGFHSYKSPLPSFRINQNVKLGGVGMKILQSLGEGAYARVYLAEIVEKNRHVALKVAQNDMLCWDFYISSEIQKRLFESSLIDRYSLIRGAHLHDNGVVYEMDYVSHITLMDVINHYKTDSKDEIPTEIVIYFTIELLQILNNLHDISIIHCDVKPDNFLVMPSDDEYPIKLHLLDFGRCIDMKLFPENTTFTQIFKPDFRCIEMRSKKPWTYQLDLFGAAATINCLLFGKYMNVMEVKGKWSSTCKPKRFWKHASLYEELFDTLLNVPSCEDIPNLSNLIDQFKDYQSKACSKAILNKKLRDILTIQKK